MTNLLDLEKAIEGVKAAHDIYITNGWSKPKESTAKQLTSVINRLAKLAGEVARQAQKQ